MMFDVRRFTQVVVALCAALVILAFAASAQASGFPRYDHIFLVTQENEKYGNIIGNRAAPILNALAKDYGLATNYHGTSDPSEPNYVATLGGSDFGLSSDDPYYFPGNSVNAPNLMSEVDAAGLTWRGYYQGMPYDGYRGFCFPAKCNGIPDADTQYVSKHNGIPSFQDMQSPAEFAKEQPYGKLASDLARGNVANFNYIVPDECHDMHGAPPWCVDSDNPGTVDDNWLVANGDKMVGQTVNEITSSPVWKSGNNAIVVTWDEGDFATDKIVAIVITNHGPRHFTDSTNYNHYSLSASLTDAFGLPCVGAEAPTPNGDGCTATPMTPLFSTNGPATTPPLPRPFVPPANTTPMPTTSPVHGPKVKLGGTGWNPVASPDLTTDNDNVLASVSAASPTDAWAVGTYYPDVSDQQAAVTGPILQTLGEHWNGSNWTAYPLPNVGDNENSLLSVSELSSGKAWAVGYDIDEGYAQKALVEHFDGHNWKVIPAPDPGTEGNILYSVAAIRDNDVWAVGGQRDDQAVWHPLIEHWNGKGWKASPFPTTSNSGSELLYAVNADSPSDVYVTGQDGIAFPERMVIGQFRGHRWSLLDSPTASSESLDPLGVSARHHTLTIVGQRESDTAPNTTLVASGRSSDVDLQQTPSQGAGENDLFSTAKAAGGSEWAAGWYIDPNNSENHEPLVEHFANGKWSIDTTPDTTDFANDGGDNGFAGIAATPGGGLWAVGVQTNASTGATQTLIEYHR